MPIGEPLTPFGSINPRGPSHVFLKNLTQMFTNLKSKNITFVIVIIPDRIPAYGELSNLASLILVVHIVYCKILFRNRQAVWRTARWNSDVLLEGRNGAKKIESCDDRQYIAEIQCKAQWNQPYPGNKVYSKYFQSFF